ncbi:hypothetical protein Pcinc_027264 [Petrolisthes cinctipes]|uniref:Uncharacterized protein n=1 Tax=Petrolisthes cinctipes TaxID=88211 RepID=A0AAE1F5C6_PETCI|nr:hypothetical protein Pcinc_027264 [Petrolisthes cinctipes]
MQKASKDDILLQPKLVSRRKANRKQMQKSSEFYLIVVVREALNTEAAEKINPKGTRGQMSLPEVLSQSVLIVTWAGDRSRVMRGSIMEGEG